MNMTALLFSLMTMALIALLASPLAADETTDPKLEDVPKLSVRGAAEIELPADRLQLSIGVVTEHSEATRALDQNSRQMNKVIEALERVGLTEDEYETGRFRLRPTYERRPRQADQDWKPKITGYEIVNSLTVKTKKIDLAGELIEAANKAGANSIDSVGFDLSDDRAGRSEAIAKATANAIADAQTLAEAASLKLVRIVSIRLGGADRDPGMMEYDRSMKAMAGGSGSPPISAGKVTVSASVLIVYEIAPAQ